MQQKILFSFCVMQYNSKAILAEENRTMRYEKLCNGKNQSDECDRQAKAMSFSIKLKNTKSNFNNNWQI